MTEVLDCSKLGLPEVLIAQANLAAPGWVEVALAHGEGTLADRGAFSVFTGKHTGRSADDKYVVQEPSVENEIDWGKVNHPLSPQAFDQLLSQARTYLQGRALFQHDGYAAADPTYRLTLRVLAEKPWHAFFSQCMFRRYIPGETPPAEPEWVILALPDLKLIPERDGTRSETAIVLSFERKIILIAGTHYAGEIKKSIFTVMNYVLPTKNVLSMHCSANLGKQGDVALFFGLSGTGKTTLSADPDRRLIGDDEHGWGENGVFNIEGGCYAKTIRLSATGEPQIWNAIRFGSVLENVPLNPVTRVPDFDNDQRTENTRVAYPLDFIPQCELSGQAGHPQNIFFLACDAFGVLPPLSLLTIEQAMEHFLRGYTAKIAGTERGVTEPKATFSACFGSPFLPLPPKRYAELLQDHLKKHPCRVWLVNTGWSGGAAGVGKRMSLAHTRALLKAALEGTIQEETMVQEPVFGLRIPSQCPGVPSSILQPRNAWADSNQYDKAAAHLAELFRTASPNER